MTIPTADRCQVAVVVPHGDRFPMELVWCKREVGHPGIHVADAEQGEYQWLQEEER